MGKSGQFVLDTFALLPTNLATFDKIFTSGLQDILMVVYLANLTRSHLLLANKMQEQST